MPRYILTIEYDGTPYLGWQAQPEEMGRTVQTALEKAILTISGETLRLTCAGRTDAGVHALGQVVHVDMAKTWKTDSLRDGLNTILGQQDDRIAVSRAALAPDGFSARLSAKRRHYLYRIHNRRQPAPLEQRRAWHVPRRLDANLMDIAAKRLLGTHDFTTFRDARCQAKSPVKTLETLDVTRVGDIIEVRASAKSFLHHQVRRMVGSLEKCGAGRWSADDLEAVLHARDRQKSGPQAPAWGLFFMGVDY
jgi:tRNA pseudouridine38-40 synthase